MKFLKKCEYGFYLFKIQVNMQPYPPWILNGRWPLKIDPVFFKYTHILSVTSLSTDSFRWALSDIIRVSETLETYQEHAQWTRKFEKW